MANGKNGSPQQYWFTRSVAVSELLKSRLGPRGRGRVEDKSVNRKINNLVIGWPVCEIIEPIDGSSGQALKYSREN